MSALLATLLLCVPQAERPDLVLADFEGPDWGAWIATGTAFGPGPARGTLPHQMEVTGFLGQGLVNTFAGGDESTGTLTSPPFRLERRFLNFLIGGGMHPGEAGVELLVDGAVVRTATGPNDRPGGSERLHWHTWNVAEFSGRRAVLRIVDTHTGGWGHVNADHFVESDRRFAADPAELARELVVEKRYLHLPVRNGAPARRMRFVVGGEVVREFRIELADGEPDFFVFADVAPWRGERLRIEVDALPAGSRGLASIESAAQVPDAAGLYREPLRPQLHFSSRRGWLNDPNGLVLLDGEWHLFYQHNPYGRSWGNMHWGHAVSRDLVHWEELGIALWPRTFGDWVFSGSAVVDRDDTGGFQTGEALPIVASFTSTGRGECVAFSNDHGRSFTEYEGNPVLVHQGRDPRILWYAPGGHWVMAVYDEHEGKRWIAFHRSLDLVHWELTSRLEGYYECPELFPLRLGTETKWVVFAADGDYTVGRFDGGIFTPEGEKERGNFGNCFYAAQTFSDVPASDGRRVRIAWGRTELAGMPFNQEMLFPCTLSLRGTAEGPRLATWPVRELELLWTHSYARGPGPLAPGDDPLAGVEAELADLELELAPGSARHVRLEVRGVPITYDAGAAVLTCQGCTAPVPLRDGILRLRVLVDRASVEIWSDGGLVYMPVSVLPDAEDRSLRLAVDGVARLEALRVHRLRSIW